MNNRIKRFMEYKGVSPSELADAIGVQRSNITHVLHGRNKPGFQFITKMLETYPEINAKWLLTGKGEMLEAGKEQEKTGKRQPVLFDHLVPPVDIDQEKRAIPEKPGREEKDGPEKKEIAGSVQPVPELLRTVTACDSRNIESIVIFYTDQTFKQYIPSK